MVRGFRVKIHMRARYIILGILLGCALLPPAGADTFTYSSTRKVIHVGIVVSAALDIGNGLGSENPDPHVWYIADSRTDLRPLGMSFDNPLAPSVITPTIYQRWLRRVRPGFTDPAFDPVAPQG